jgi:hypothetical protein
VLKLQEFMRMLKEPQLQRVEEILMPKAKVLLLPVLDHMLKEVAAVQHRIALMLKVLVLLRLDLIRIVRAPVLPHLDLIRIVKVAVVLLLGHILMLREPQLLRKELVRMQKE